jgi:hypothetical protein
MEKVGDAYFVQSTEQDARNPFQGGVQPGGDYLRLGPILLFL